MRTATIEILDLPRGAYRLTATHPGFKTFIADNVVLESSQVRRINVAFELGAASVGGLGARRRGRHRHGEPARFRLPSRSNGSKRCR